MTIFLPESLKPIFDELPSHCGFGSSSEHLRELVRGEQDRLHLYGLLLAGANSGSTTPADAAYFASMRERIHQRS
jgi:antitoxin ParD1/3/4